MDKLKKVLAQREKLACSVEAARTAELSRDNRGQVCRFHVVFLVVACIF